MRILLRSFDGKEYVWKDATYSKEQFYIDGKKVEETNIAATDGHNMENHVICAFCGEIVENNESAIEKHYADMESKRDCKSCDKLYVDGDEDTLSRNITDNGDGTYNVVQTMKARLYCRGYYSRYDIDSKRAKEICKFLQCRRTGMRKPTDLFSVYPDVFDSVITVDVLAKQKFKFFKKGYVSYGGDSCRNLYLYDMKSRGTIQACVNSSGIVECFKASSAGNTYYFFYSEKYDKLFWAKYGTYREGRPGYFSAKKFEEVYKKAKALYEAAKEEKK